jgi:hypothetical protein
VNDLALEIKSGMNGVNIDEKEYCILMYADDIVLISDNEDRLQKSIEIMYEWCNKWKLKLNTSKTKIMHFRPAKTLQSKVIFKYGRAILEKVEQYKYLGIIFDSYLKYDKCIEVLSGSSGRALGAVISKFKTLRDLRYNTFKCMYEKCVVPIMDYGAEVWGLRKAGGCDQVQNKALRFYIGVHKFAPLLAIQGDIGWLTPINRRAICMLRLWNRIINMDEDRIPKALFISEHSKDIGGWCSDVESILDQIGLKHVYDECIVCDLRECERRLRELLQNEFLQDIQAKPKLRSYIKFKQNFATEPYISMGLSRERRSLLGQLRCGVLPLEIERGRFKIHKDKDTGQIRKLKLEERICRMCSLGELEDELHFVCVCPKYEVCRNIMIRQVQQGNNSFIEMTAEGRFIYLLQNCCKELSNYLKDAWHIRKRALYTVT